MGFSKQDQQHIFALTQSYLNNGPPLDPEMGVSELSKILRFHEWKYYVQADPVISDFEYDKLFKFLQEFESRHPNLIKSDSPTQRVSSDLTSDFPTVSHLTPMLSLDNSYNSEDLYDFDKQVKKLGELEADTKVQYAVEPKYDGGSIAVVYEGDRLYRAATRGNGEAGDEVTANIRTMKSVPLFAPFSKSGIHRAELRGEAMIRKSVFEKINEIRQADEQPVFANTRNAAAGGLRMKDPRETAERGIEVIFYQLGFAADVGGSDKKSDFTLHSETITLLSNLGFKTAEKDSAICHGIDEVIALSKQWEAKRDDYPYEIDGLVIKVNDYELQKKCGFTSHHPRWAMAYKFKAKQATSKLLRVEYQAGKTGNITPVAKMEPVQLAGVMISSASLHNEDFINERDIREGDHVLIERAGDVIPYIVKPLTELRDGNEKPLIFPRICPFDQTEQTALIREEGEAAWRCPKCICGEQDLQQLIFHVSKNAMDIDGFGKSLVERFFRMGWIKQFPDLYTMNYEEIAALEGLGEKSSTNLEQAVEKAKSQPIYRLLHGLCIHHLGKRASKILASRIEHVLDLQNWEEQDYMEIKDIGPVLARNMSRWFSDSANISMLNTLDEAGVNLRQTEEDKPIEVSADAPLVGKTILFTGTLKTMGRKDAKKLAEQHGARVLSAVSSNLDILVIGEKAGSKLKKAQDNGKTEIMTEEAFLELVSG